MKRFPILFLLTALVGGMLQAQSTVDAVLASIDVHNKVLQAHTRYVEAQKAEFKTGLSPSDPMVELDYMIGSPATAGNQTDFTVTQALDFPTVYAQKRQLSAARGLQVDYEMLGTRQSVLLEAKRLCLDIVHHRQRIALLQRRLKRVETLRLDYQYKLEGGYGNVLDLNKFKLEEAALRQALQSLSAELAALDLELIALNGGEALAFADTVYPDLPVLPPLPQLEAEVEAADPLLAALQQEVKVAQEAMDLSKALKLPRMEVGYHYQGILGQTYNGMHAGIAVPLWERRHTVEAQQAAILVASTSLEGHHSAHIYKMRGLHQQFLALQASQAELDALVNGLDAEQLLTKALNYGEISVITFLMELGYYDDAQDQLLEMAYRQQGLATELFQHRLIGK